MMMWFGGAPSSPPPLPPIPPPPPPITDDDDELAALARKRADLERRRTGRRSLRIDLEPGISAQSAAGLQIPVDLP